MYWGEQLMFWINAIVLPSQLSPGPTRTPRRKNKVLRLNSSYHHDISYLSNWKVTFPEMHISGKAPKTNSVKKSRKVFDSKKATKPWVKTERGTVAGGCCIVFPYLEIAASYFPPDQNHDVLQPSDMKTHRVHWVLQVLEQNARFQPATKHHHLQQRHPCV